MPAILGPEMGASILWTPGKCVLSAGKTHVHKIPRFRGGGYFGFGGGGECRFYFYGRADFSELLLATCCPWADAHSTRRILGTRCFQNGHFGRISSTLYFTMLQCLGVSHASAKRVPHEPCFRQVRCFARGPLHFLLVPPIPHAVTCAHSHNFRVACLQNETGPEKLLNRYEKRFEKREKKIRKTIRNATEIFSSPSQAA